MVVIVLWIDYKCSLSKLISVEVLLSQMSAAQDIVVSSVVQSQVKSQVSAAQNLYRLEIRLSLDENNFVNFGTCILSLRLFTCVWIIYEI